MTNDVLRATFFSECEELIEDLGTNLDYLSNEKNDVETLNAVFRSVHSIKGAAGAFGFEDLVTFAHHYETVLDEVRLDRLVLEGEILRLVVRASDVLAELVDCARLEDASLPSNLDQVTSDLKNLVNPAGEDSEDYADSASEGQLDFAPTAIDFSAIASPIVIDRRFRIRLDPDRSLYLNGHDPQKLITALARLGTLEVECDTSNIPSLAEFDFDEGYLTWDISLNGETDEEAIASVFTFVSGLCDLAIDPLEDEPPASFPDPEASDNGSGTSAPVFDNAAAQTPTDTSQEPPQPSKDASGSTPSYPKSVGAPAAKATPLQTTLRVDPSRVDRLINSVGELIINHAVIHRTVHEVDLATDENMTAALEHYGNLAREIQEAVMSIRAQPVKALFQRMGRVVREAAEATQKDATFVTEGESTEIDKTMLERLADPLTHMLRNAVDHGIEVPDVRMATGKPANGTVTLSAYHRSGQVVIEISDDGAGLDRARILQKAVEKNLIQADNSLSDSEVFNLLFEPGFSTAQEVTNLSGRGVGMDVVKTAITSLGGKVSIASEPGQGSVFSISLPLTLAVLDGMIVEVGREKMVLPLSSIIETVRSTRHSVHEVSPGDHVLSLRNSYVPIVDLQLLLAAGSSAPSTEFDTFVIVEANGSTFAIAVGAIHDQRQVVIKSLKANYGDVPGISAATILGDGKVALIVDPEALRELAGRRRQVKILEKLGNAT